MTERRPLVNISGEDQELPAGDTLPGTASVEIAAVSRAHSSDLVLTETPTNVTWNVERITLDATYFSTATDNDIEVAKTLAYEINVTASYDCITVTPEGFLDIFVDGSAVTALREIVKFNNTTQQATIYVSTILELTAGERVGPRFSREQFNGTITALANSFQWTLKPLETTGAEPAPGSGDFVGPASAVDSNLVGFDTTTGKLGKDSGIAAAAVLERDGSVVMTGNLQMGLNDVVGFIPTAGTGSSTSLKDFFTAALSSGHEFGGDLSPQGTPSNSVDVAAGTGLLRSIDDQSDPLRSIGWDLFNSGTLSIDTETYFGVQWNSGTPIVVAKGTDVWNYQDEFPLGNAVRDSTGIHLTFNPHSIGDAPGETARRLFEVAEISRDARLGGLLIGETGTRNITLSAGAFWSRLNRIPVAAVDTSVSGSVDFYYETAPSVFAVDAARTDWPNTQYGDGTSLVTMTNGRYAVIWWYLDFDGDIVAQYGRNQYTKIADAEEESVPNTAPLRIANHAGLIGRTIFQESASTTISISSIFTQQFSSLGVQSHPDLTNINPDDHHNQVHDLSGADHNASTLANFNTKISDATLDDAGDSRPPDSHAFAGADHSVSTLAQVNTKISDATLDDSGDSRPPSGTAAGSLTGSYPNPGVADGADSTAIHDNVPNEITGITEKTLPLGDDKFAIESEADSSNKRSVALRNMVPVIAMIPIDTKLGTSTISGPVPTHPRALRARRIRAQFTGAITSGTYTFVVRTGVDIDTLSITVGTVTVTGTASKGASGVISVAIPALYTTVVEMTGVGVHSGTDLQQICMISMEAELD